MTIFPIVQGCIKKKKKTTSSGLFFSFRIQRGRRCFLPKSLDKSHWSQNSKLTHQSKHLNGQRLPRWIQTFHQRHLLHRNEPLLRCKILSLRHRLIQTQEYGLDEGDPHSLNDRYIDIC